MYKVSPWVLGAWVFTGCVTPRPQPLRIEPGPAMRSETAEPARMMLPGFELDAPLVTRGAYAACVRLGACEAVASAGPPEEPMSQVTWEQADQYCAWQGKRLPTLRELERVREVNPNALQLERDEWVDGWYTYYGEDFFPHVVAGSPIANLRLVRGGQYYGRALGGSPRIGFRCSRWLLRQP
jgi:hypothetical protein